MKAAPTSDHGTTGRFLGRGRSAAVYLGSDIDGNRSANKVFVGSTLAGIVNYLILGTHNPYTWSAASIEAAASRRRLASLLVRWWMPSLVRVARVIEVRWNEERRANELSTEFVEGRPVTLHHPFSQLRDDEFRELNHDVMKPLQEKLIEAGLDGLAWQAGLGQPVALSNFLRETSPEADARWAWIDLESGVPAMFAWNPVQLFGFYLPRAIQYGHPMFDDVNVPKFRAYLEHHRSEIIEALGPEALEELVSEAEKLKIHQDEWSALSRVQRGVRYRLRRGHISQEQADWYLKRPIRWYSQESVRCTCALTRRARDRVRRLLSVPWKKMLGAPIRFLASGRFRAALAKKYVHKRIHTWVARKHLEDRDRGVLIRELRQDETSLYLTDFGVHLSIKPFVKALTWLLVPSLLALGVGTPAIVASVVAFGGAAGRTVYTLLRMIGATLRGSRLPWVALLVGLLPIVGNVAFPMQIIYDGTGRRSPLAQFILYDLLAQLGERVPIWGGRDTATEYYCNRMGNLVVHDRSPMDPQESRSAASATQDPAA